MIEKIKKWLETTRWNWKEFSKRNDAEHKAQLRKDAKWIRAARARGSIF